MTGFTALESTSRQQIQTTTLCWQIPWQKHMLGWPKRSLRGERSLKIYASQKDAILEEGSITSSPGENLARQWCDAEYDLSQSHLSLDHLYELTCLN